MDDPAVRHTNILKEIRESTQALLTKLSSGELRAEMGPSRDNEEKYTDELIKHLHRQLEKVDALIEIDRVKRAGR